MKIKCLYVMKPPGGERWAFPDVREDYYYDNFLGMKDTEIFKRIAADYLGKGKTLVSINRVTKRGKK